MPPTALPSAQTPARGPGAGGPSGFTLIELLVVIGIIALLAGILIPVVGHIRIAGYETSTKAEIQTLSGAIEQYHNTFNYYPGPIDNANVGGASPTAQYTGTENMTLGLFGGLQSNGSFTATDVGQGPLSLNPARVQRYPATLDTTTVNMLKKTGTTWASGGADLLAPYGNTGKAFKDSVVPEVLDRFPDPLPILYIRAKVGATGITNRGVGSQFNTKELDGYNFPEPNSVRVASALRDNKNDYFLQQTIPWSQTVYDRYFGNPTLTATPYQKDGFILITAGKDRIYGSGDDLCNFGSPK